MTIDRWSKVDGSVTVVVTLDDGSMSTAVPFCGTSAATRRPPSVRTNAMSVATPPTSVRLIVGVKSLGAPAAEGPSCSVITFVSFAVRSAMRASLASAGSPSSTTSPAGVTRPALEPLVRRTVISGRSR